MGDICTAAVVHRPAAAAAAAVGHQDVKWLQAKQGLSGLLHSCSNAGLMNCSSQALLRHSFPGSSCSSIKPQKEQHKQAAAFK
jgi:hypothetical protein